MPTDIIMPQMGESIVEGTITKWLKKPGDKVQRDEPLFEISTDKVDAEIPAPASGVLAGHQSRRRHDGWSEHGRRHHRCRWRSRSRLQPKPRRLPRRSPPQPRLKRRRLPRQLQRPSHQQPRLPPTANEEDEEARSSPLVRKIAREHGISLSQVSGTGLGGRITKQDIMSVHREPGIFATGSRCSICLCSACSRRSSAPPGSSRALPGDLVPMTNMRKIIAQHMIESRRTSAHVHCMYEVDFTRIVNLRNKHKAGFEQRHGARLTFMPFFVRAAVMALQQWPIINASLEGDNIRYHRHINMGIAVALDWGLIVPVLKNAGDLNFLGLQRGITDLGERARTKKLKPDDVEGSTFTVTNPGQFGAVFGLPIINQPNSAIMGVGGITKQPMVITDKDGTDSIAIRSVVHLTLGYDHRLIDGAVADQFMDLVKKTLETWSEEVG